jgi:ribosome-associated protein
MLTVDNYIQIPLAEIHFSYVRSSGPGGQNVNKVASKAVLRWNPAASQLLPETVLKRFQTQFPRCVTNDGEIIITSQRTRDALKNKTDCLEKLRTMILHVLKEPKRRIPTKPTRGSIKRRLETKARNSQKKQNRRVIGGE